MFYLAPESCEECKIAEKEYDLMVENVKNGKLSF